MNFENNGESKETPQDKRLVTESLFQGRNEVLILHQGMEYRLRITKNDKLILTK